MSFDYADLIGCEFEYRARGPEKWDCFGLLREMYKRRNKIELPDYKKTPRSSPGINRLLLQEIHKWTEVQRQPNVAVLIKIHGLCGHVGYMIDYSRMIHASEELKQVVIDKIDSPDFRHRVVGWYNFEPNE